jgi:hypothetical protein
MESVSAHYGSVSSRCSGYLLGCSSAIALRPSCRRIPFSGLQIRAPCGHKLCWTPGPLTAPSKAESRAFTAEFIELHTGLPQALHLGRCPELAFGPPNPRPSQWRGAGPSMTRTPYYRVGFPQRRPDGMEPVGGARRATGQHPRTIRCYPIKPPNIERAVSTCEGAKEPMLFQRNPHGRGQNTTGAQVPHPPRRGLFPVCSGCFWSPGLRAGLSGDV